MGNLGFDSPSSDIELAGSASCRRCITKHQSIGMVGYKQEQHIGQQILLCQPSSAAVESVLVCCRVHLVMTRAHHSKIMLQLNNR